MTKRMKERVYEILDLASGEDRISRIFDILIMVLIVLNVMAVILETVESLDSKYHDWFMVFEVFSVIIFSIEYILRVWSATSVKRYKHPFLGRLRFIFTFMALVDLFAILPFYLPLLIPMDLRFIRGIKLIRLLRLLKMTRYSHSIGTFGAVMKKKKEELMIAVFVIIILLITASSLLYFVENDAQPDAFSSIPASMWWGVATLTTVGYGDMYPITGVGRFLAAIIAILGIGMFALPAGILAGGFADELQKQRDLKKQQRKAKRREKEGKATHCPHCGKDINKK